MNNDQAQDAIKQMINFINNEAEEKRIELKQKGDAEYTAGTYRSP